jgi:hypothetical protein
MFPMRWIAALALAAPLAAQPVAPARAGLISYTEGIVSVDGRPVWVEAARFPEIAVGGVLRTEAGRAEVLLAPCAALRIAENSSFRMVANAVAATRIELLSGTAIVDIGELPRGAALAVTVEDARVNVAKAGTYRFDFTPPSLKVFQGSATVGAITVAAGRELAPIATGAPSKLAKEAADAFDQWRAHRTADQARASGAARARAREAQTLAAAANASANTEPVPNPDRYPTSARDAAAPGIFASPARIGAYGLPGCAEPK